MLTEGIRARMRQLERVGKVFDVWCVVV